MINVVVALFTSAKITPSVLVHLSNALPVGAVFAMIVTAEPAENEVLFAVPLFTVRV
jgi:hypothetical protein